MDLGLVAPQKSRHQASRGARVGVPGRYSTRFTNFGGYVDWSKRYKTATGLAMVGTVIALLFIATCDCLAAPGSAVLLLGCLAGPVQPLAAELAVEVTYPDGDENTIVALMQALAMASSWRCRRF